MKRYVVFVLLGPVFGVLVAYAVLTVATGGYVELYGIPLVLFFTLIVGAITGPIDGVLTYVAPVWLRVPLTSIVGAVVSVGVAVGLSAWFSTHLGKAVVLPPPDQMIPIAAFGAFITGVYSLLSHNYRHAKA